MRSKRVEIRLSEEEYEELMLKKTKPRLAEWIREEVLNREDKVKKRVVVDEKFLYELNKIGNNLNQIAKYCNVSKKGFDVNNARLLAELIKIDEKLDLLLREVKNAGKVF